MNKAIQFSGGKDSIVCLHLFKDEPDIKVIFTNTGNAFMFWILYLRPVRALVCL